MVVGCCVDGRGGSTVGVAADRRLADVLAVAGAAGIGAAVVAGTRFNRGGDIAGGVAVDGGVDSLGVTIFCAGRVGWSNTTAIAAATVSVARTTPARTIRFDQRLLSSRCAGAWNLSSRPSPADSSPSSGSNR
jgi:hypothetical protein